MNNSTPHPKPDSSLIKMNVRSDEIIPCSRNLKIDTPEDIGAPSYRNQNQTKRATSIVARIFGTIDVLRSNYTGHRVERYTVRFPLCPRVRQRESRKRSPTESSPTDYSRMSNILAIWSVFYGLPLFMVCPYGIGHPLEKIPGIYDITYRYGSGRLAM